MFTLKQIQEIAAKLASTAVKDSQFEEINYPFDGTESVPILQDGANKKISFAEFMNIIFGNDDAALNIGCNLEVICNTTGATILINNQTRQNNIYNGHYGEIVNVVITKEGYDTFYESVTLTNNHTLAVSLNSNTQGGLPGVITHSVRVINSQGATITINGSPVASGAISTFAHGSRVEIIVSRDGYETETRIIESLEGDFSETITLLIIEPVEPGQEDPGTLVLAFKDDEDIIQASSSGGTYTTTVLSNISWEIETVDMNVPTYNEQSDTEEEEDSSLPKNIYGSVGDKVGLD